MAYCIDCGCLSEKYCELINPGDRFADKGEGPILLEPEGMMAFSKEVDMLKNQFSLQPD